MSDEDRINILSVKSFLALENDVISKIEDWENLTDEQRSAVQKNFFPDKLDLLKDDYHNALVGLGETVYDSGAACEDIDLAREQVDQTYRLLKSEEEVVEKFDGKVQLSNEEVSVFSENIDTVNALHDGNARPWRAR